jgi:hypothetical protein
MATNLERLAKLQTQIATDPCVLTEDEALERVDMIVTDAWEPGVRESIRLLVSGYYLHRQGTR